MHDDEKILSAIVTLLESNIGYGIELFGLLLSVSQLEDLSYSVKHQKYDAETRSFVFDFEEIFEDAREATKFFLQKRREFELGFDFEVERDAA